MIFNSFNKIMVLQEQDQVYWFYDLCIAVPYGVLELA
jgi:hypothetical protein